MDYFNARVGHTIGVIRSRKLKNRQYYVQGKQIIQTTIHTARKTPC